MPSSAYGLKQLWEGIYLVPHFQVLLFLSGFHIVEVF